MENLKYHYLNKKIIEVKMKNKVNLQHQAGITILKDKGYNLKIELDCKKKAVKKKKKMLDADKIVDINISSIPLEDIITQIYKGARK